MVGWWGLWQAGWQPLFFSLLGICDLMDASFCLSFVVLDDDGWVELRHDGDGD